MSKHRQITRAATVAAGVAAFGLLTAGVASAHVTANVYGAPAEQGGYTAITMRVPNEDEKAGTNKLTVHFAEEYGLARVRTKPLPGWTAKITKSKLDEPIKTDEGAELTEVVTAVTWTAKKGSEIKAGETEYQEFSFSTGPLPEVDELVLPSDQTYTDGKVVSWEQEGEESERPAPVVALAPSSGDHHGGSKDQKAHAEADANGEHEEASSEEASGVDTTARWLGGIGLGVGALGAGFGAGAILRSRKKAAQQ
jgi:uncharacterized protein YcnI